MNEHSEEALKTEEEPKLSPLPNKALSQSSNRPGGKAGLVLCSIVLASLAIIAIGVHMGANGEGRAYTGMVLWIADLLQSM